MSVNAITAANSANIEKTSIFSKIFKKNEDSSLFACNDGANDGKIGFSQGANVFFTGMKDKAIDQVETIVEGAKEHPANAILAGSIGIAATIGLGLLSVAFPPVAIGVGILGAGFGLYQTGKAVKQGAENYDNYKNAKDDNEALLALYAMGGNATQTLEGAAMTAMSAKTAVNGAKAVAGGLAVDLVNTNSSWTNSTQRTLLKPFLSKEQVSVANSILTNTESTAREYANAIYASQHLDFLASQAQNAASVDSFITGTMGTAALVEQSESLFYH